MKKYSFLISFTFCLAFFSAKPIFAQNPIIYGFSPSSGSVGSTVSISGAYFKLSGPIPPKENNNPPIIMKPPLDYTAVRFSDYSAVILSESATNLQVRVPQIPLGSYKIWVCNANGCTQSSSYFTVTTPPRHLLQI